MRPFHVFLNGPGNGWWIGGMILTVLFWGAVVLLILAAIRHFGGYHVHEHSTVPPRPLASAGSESALDTLKMRFARGEIDEDEFKRRADLLAGH
ncbi:MAG TPA: SHOCT domain-containing protein [Acidimicrobiales bacterium]|nr:SHOCT domain-containing protein [Acidimicrobiales bacterium]